MKEHRLIEGPARCNSKRHLEVWEQLKSQFPGYRIYNEYTYTTIVNGPGKAKGFSQINSRLRADIFVKDIGVIIEIMGEQHYGPVVFGGDGKNAEKQFVTQQNNDHTKRHVAESNGLLLLELPFYITVPTKLDWLSLFSDIIKEKELGAYIITENDYGRGFSIKKIDLEGNIITSEEAITGN